MDNGISPVVARPLNRDRVAKLSRRTRFALIVVAVGAGVLANRLAWRERALPPSALLPRVYTPVDPQAKSSTAPIVLDSWVDPQPDTAASHASSLALLPDGRMAAVWWGGAREGAKDVALYMATRKTEPDATWSPPRVLLTPTAAEDEIHRNVRKLGNAVLFTDPANRVWLVYVSVSLGGWSGSTLNVKRSDDGGTTWTQSQRLSLGPFLNFSTLVRAKPFFTADGQIGLPVYHEFVNKYPQVLWLTPGSDRAVERFHIRQAAVATSLLQPAIVPLDGNRALMLLRDSSDRRRLHSAISNDMGWTWSEPRPLELGNPDAGFDVLKLADGRLLLAYNEGRHGRHLLRLAVSDDAGASWRPGPYVENEPSGEYSYPSLALDRSGHVHLSYTWRRERIRHVEFNAVWLDQPGAALTAAKL